MTVAVNILSQVYPDLTAHMDEEDRAYLAASLELKRASRGEPVIAYGEVSDRLFMIGEGDLVITLPTEEGGEVDLGRRGAGRWVGELGVIEPGPASATVSAATDATLWVLTHEAFETMRTERPCAAGRLMEAVAKDVAERMRACNSVLFRSTDDGAVEIVPKQEAKEGVLARLVHEIKDLFDLGAVMPPGEAAAADRLAAPMSLDTFLKEHPSFGRLPVDDRERLQQACDVKEFEDGHPMIREGDGRDSVYFLLDGRVEVQVERPDGATFATDRIMGPGEIIGLVAIVDRGKRSATCSARGVVKAAVLSLEGVNLLMNTSAPVSCAFQYALASQLAKDARNLNESLLHAAAHPDA